MSDPEQLAERYVAAVESFARALRAVPIDRMADRDLPSGWSPRDIAFHVADVDQLLGLRLRHILSDDNPELAAINTHGNVEQFRRIRGDRSLALDTLDGSSGLNAAVMEVLTPDQLKRTGRHPHGHDVTAVDVAKFFSMHIEAHVKQLARVLDSAG